MGALGNFGRSQARRVDPEKIRVTFDDVAGIDEAKAELTEIVDFLRDPERYARLGGRMPHGVLLSGPPGTGKTLLARAVAGEAHAAFFSISASEFIEAIVGVGASRVRDLFAKAKEAAPAIIFIDELDAIGRSRQGSVAVTGANDEREQTLDQILTEMDGFESNRGGRRARRDQPPRDPRPGAAAPRALRPPRRGAAPRPRRARARSSRSTPARCRSPTTSTSTRSPRATPGMVGADLANLANEAALLAARRDHDKVQMADFTDSLEKILLGAPRGIVLSPEDRERTAYHESGHALVGMLTPGADPVRKVSIIPRGMALGVTLSTPDADRVSYSREELEAKISVALGGRVAEEVVYGKITTGAESDIQQLTQIARQMVGRWGMSEKIGPIAVLPTRRRRAVPARRQRDLARRPSGWSTRRSAASSTRPTPRSPQLLTDHRDQLESLAHALLEAETLDAADAYAAARVPMRAAELSPSPNPRRRQRACSGSRQRLGSRARGSADAREHRRSFLAYGLEVARIEAEKPQDRRRDRRRLDERGPLPRRHRGRREHDYRHVAVLGVGAAVLGDLARAAGIHDAVLNDAPDVGMTWVADGHPEVASGRAHRRRPGAGPSARASASYRRRCSRSRGATTGSRRRNRRPPASGLTATSGSRRRRSPQLRDRRRRGGPASKRR